MLLILQVAQLGGIPTQLRQKASMGKAALAALALRSLSEGGEGKLGQNLQFTLCFLAKKSELI